VIIRWNDRCHLVLPSSIWAEQGDLDVKTGDPSVGSGDDRTAREPTPDDDPPRGPRGSAGQHVQEWPPRTGQQAREPASGRALSPGSLRLLHPARGELNADK